MTRIDLLPPRYHQFRAFAKQIYWGLVGLAALLIILGTALVGMKARTTAYARMSEILSPSARQYRTINTRVDELQKAEKVLTDRKGKAVPLLDRGRSILPTVQDFTRGLPAGTSLTSLSVGLDGAVSLQGQAKTYNDVARFVKWLGENLKYEKVVLSGVQRGQGQTVQFGVTAVRPLGGDGR